MTSLSEAYHGDAATRAGNRRLVLGFGLFSTGVLLVVAGILVAGTELLLSRGYGLGDVRLYGGILGGLGVPAVFLGIFSVLPASRNTRAAALVGASLAIFGVALFAHAYPCQWIGNTCSIEAVDLTLPTAGIYSLGIITTFWCLFTGVVNFKTRNDPGGTVKMNVTRRGETRVVEVEKPSGGFGGIGLFGTEPDGEVETQTNTIGSTASDGGDAGTAIRSPLDASTAHRRTTDTTTTTTTSATVDTVGGGTVNTASTTTDEQTRGADRSGAATADDAVVEYRSDSRLNADAPIDRYCGSCEHFQYVRTDEGIQPYCGYHSGLMENMDACEQWSKR
ncbi:MAG: DUF7139 domain-containing protein [Halobacteriota archaeon]